MAHVVQAVQVECKLKVTLCILKMTHQGKHHTGGKQSLMSVIAVFIAVLIVRHSVHVYSTI